jgi:hypothetical protein
VSSSRKTGSKVPKDTTDRVVDLRWQVEDGKIVPQTTVK